MLQILKARTLWIRLVRRDRRNAPWDARLTLWSIIADTDDSDVQLALLVPLWRTRRQKPRSGNKVKSKARPDRLDFADVEAFREDAPLGGSHNWIMGTLFICFY